MGFVHLLATDGRATGWGVQSTWLGDRDQPGGGGESLEGGIKMVEIGVRHMWVQIQAESLSFVILDKLFHVNYVSFSSEVK